MPTTMRTGWKTVGSKQWLLLTVQSTLTSAFLWKRDTVAGTMVVLTTVRNV